MFCPKCAAQNIDGASFCRVCGANISLVPRALSGQPLAVQEDNSREGRRRKMRGRREASIEHSLKNVFVGIAWLLIAFVLSWTGRGAWWWIWLLIPAFSSLGQGVAEYIRYRDGRGEPKPLPGYAPPQTFAEPRVPASLPSRNTGELVAPPPSVTEGTTRHLGAEAPTRHLDSESDYRN